MIENKQTKKIAYLKREKIVLTEEMKNDVIKRVKEVIAWVKKHYKVEMPLPEIHFDLKRLVAGQARYHMVGDTVVDPKLRFHPIFLAENLKDYVHDTVPHEVLHLAVRYIFKKPKEGRTKIQAHGPEWRELMVKFGLGPGHERSWKQIIFSHYDPSSLDLPPKRKLGPRKPGGRTVGELLAKIKKLKPDELEAFLMRMGMEIKNPPEVQEEVDALSLHLHQSKDYRKLKDGTHSVAGWALNTIITLEESA